MARRGVLGMVGAALIWFALPGVALADPAGPTRYDSDVVAIDPDVDGVEVRVVGGDSFLHLTVHPGHTVTVLGYSGEPYLRFDADGAVFENRNSPAKYLNEDRYAAAEVPPNADAAAVADWVHLDDDGSWAWHDHRTHWMASEPPLGLEPGDQVLDEQVDLVVDGVPVAVSVVSRWVPGPSHVATVLGALVGIAVSLAVLAQVRRGRPAARRHERVPGMALFAAGASAMVVGLWQTRSLPAETGPPITHWLLPLVALAGASWSVLRPSTTAGRTAGVAAGVELAVWAALRRDVLRYPVLPTDAPYWLDRGVTAGVAVVALVACAVLVGDLLRAPTTGGAGGGPRPVEVRPEPSG